MYHLIPIITPLDQTPVEFVITLIGGALLIFCNIAGIAWGLNPQP